MSGLDPSLRLARIEGCLLGLAVGDALGLPREGLTPQRAAHLFGEGRLSHRFILGKGMCSDDTEHTCMVGQALLASQGEPKAFAHSLGWRLRWWLLGLPAGVGFATLRAILKLWVGISPKHSGVRSAGNGPAMRAPLQGALARPGTKELKEWVKASTCLTHTDPLAEEGALLVALAAQTAAWRNAEAIDPAALLSILQTQTSSASFQKALLLVRKHLDQGSTGPQFAEALGCQRGISGYILHTVPAALFCWLRHPNDFHAAVEEVIRLGGDADTTAAIVGGLAGATLGREAIPSPWLEGMTEWPRSQGWIRELGVRLHRQFPSEGSPQTQQPLSLPWILLPIRNAVFLFIVLGHGFRRLLPPY